MASCYSSQQTKNHQVPSNLAGTSLTNQQGFVGFYMFVVIPNFFEVQTFLYFLSIQQL
jgi:hypothetical protein